MNKENKPRAKRVFWWRQKNIDQSKSLALNRFYVWVSYCCFIYNNIRFVSFLIELAATQRHDIIQMLVFFSFKFYLLKFTLGSVHVNCNGIEIFAHYWIYCGRTRQATRFWNSPLTLQSQALFYRIKTIYSPNWFYSVSFSTTITMSVAHSIPECLTFFMCIFDWSARFDS